MRDQMKQLLQFGFEFQSLRGVAAVVIRASRISDKSNEFPFSIVGATHPSGLSS